MQLWTCPECKTLYLAGTRHKCPPKGFTKSVSGVLYFDKVEDVIENLRAELPVNDDSVQSIIIAQFLMGGQVKSHT